MKRIITAAVFILLLAPFIIAHSLESKFIIKTDGQYNIKFSTDPEFPLVNKKTHLDLEIWDNNGDVLDLASIEVIIRSQVTDVPLAHGHYELEHVFKSPGVYSIVPSIKGEQLNIEFDVEIDSFGTSGLIRAGIIILLYLVLIGLAYEDCKKNGGKK